MTKFKKEILLTIGTYVMFLGLPIIGIILLCMGNPGGWLGTAAYVGLWVFIPALLTMLPIAFVQDIRVVINTKDCL